MLFASKMPKPRPNTTMPARVMGRAPAVPMSNSAGTHKPVPNALTYIRPREVIRTARSANIPPSKQPAKGVSDAGRFIAVRAPGHCPAVFEEHHQDHGVKHTCGAEPIECIAPG